MGLYSTIQCQYPLPQPIIPLGYSGSKDFQTKDFDEDMRLYVINESGQLLRREEEVKWTEGDKNAKNWLDRLGSCELIKEWWTECNYTGCVNMYDYITSDELDHDFSIEYEVKFENGIVKEVRLFKFETDSNHSRKENERKWQKEMEDLAAFQKTRRYKYFFKYYNSFIFIIFRTICSLLNTISTNSQRLRMFLWRVENKLKVSR